MEVCWFLTTCNHSDISFNCSIFGYRCSPLNITYITQKI